MKRERVNRFSLKKPTKQSIIYSTSGMGIGDSILGLIPICGAIKKHKYITYSVNSNNHPWINLFDHGSTLIEYQKGKYKDFNRGYNKEMLTHAEVPRWQRYCDSINVKPIVPDVVNKEITSYKDCIAFCIKSHHSTRNWKYEYWIELENIFTNHGEKIVIIHNNPTYLKGFKSETCIGKTVEEVGSIIYNSKYCICIDSGMAHIANLMGKTMYVLCGPVLASKLYYNPVVEITSCGGIEPNCKGCYFQNPYKSSLCSAKCDSLYSITPLTVFNKCVYNIDSLDLLR